MNNGATPTRDALDDKANRLFAGKVVRKDLVRKVKVGANVPVFVLEFLLGKYCASSDPVSIQMGLQVVNDTLANNYIRSDESMKAQATVKDRGFFSFTKNRPDSSRDTPAIVLTLTIVERWICQNCVGSCKLTGRIRGVTLVAPH